MLTFLLILLFTFTVVIPLIRGMRAIYRARRAARQYFEQFRQAAAGTQSSYGNQASAKQQSARRKKINPDDGEFVQFEDLPADAPTVEKTQTTTIIEQQIVDVEWEDIK